jgi:TPR repeat protein
MQDLSINQSTRYADQGDVAFAYLAGIRFKNRILGAMQFRRDGSLESDNTGQSYQLGVLETDELAFKYLSQAAEGNVALAMQSLADCYENGTGVKKSMRMCSEWLWRASLLHSAGALPVPESNCHPE